MHVDDESLARDGIRVNAQCCTLRVGLEDVSEVGEDGLARLGAGANNVVEHLEENALRCGEVSKRSRRSSRSMMLTCRPPRVPRRLADALSTLPRPMAEGSERYALAISGCRKRVLA